MRGASPYSTKMLSAPFRAVRACNIAWPVPSGSACVAVSHGVADGVLESAAILRNNYGYVVNARASDCVRNEMQHLASANAVQRLRGAGLHARAHTRG